MEKRNRYTAEFKANVGLELLREELTLNEVAAKYQLNPQMISQWKSDFVKNASVAFERNKDGAGKLRKEMEEKESRYQQIIGQSYEIDWLKKKIWPQVTLLKNVRTWLNLRIKGSTLLGKLTC